MALFTVQYDPDLQDDLLEAWLAGDATRRAKITQLTSFVDRILASAGDRVGVDYASQPGLKVWLPREYPEAEIIFTVSSDDRFVRVTRIILRPRPSA